VHVDLFFFSRTRRLSRAGWTLRERFTAAAKSSVSWLTENPKSRPRAASLGYLGILKQRFGGMQRIQAHPAHPCCQNAGFNPNCGRANGAHVAARPRANDENIVGIDMEEAFS